MEQALAILVRLKNRPLIGCTMAFAAGIAMVQPGGWVCYAPVAVLLLCVIGCAAIPWLRKQAQIYLWAIPLCAVLGALRCSADLQVPETDLVRLAGGMARVTGRVVSDVEEPFTRNAAGPARLRFVLEAQSAEQSRDSTLRDVTGRVMVLVAAGGAKPQYGETISITGYLGVPDSVRNPGETDRAFVLAVRGIHTTLSCSSPEDWAVLRPSESAIPTPETVAMAARHAVIARNSASMRPEAAGFVNAVMLGAREQLSPRALEELNNCGLAHLLATAGLHVAALGTVIIALCSLAHIRKKPAAVITLAALGMYAIMTGERPAAIRACIMGAIYLGGTLLKREPDAAVTISAAALCILAVTPLALFETGFQISFAAVITIVLGVKAFGPALKSTWDSIKGQSPIAAASRGLARYVLESAFVIGLAQLGSMPLVAAAFNRVSPSGFAVNMIVAPTIAPLVGLGFIASAAGAIYAPASVPIYSVLERIAEWVLHVAHTFSAAEPESARLTASPSPGSIAIYYLILWGVPIAVILWRNAKKRGKEDRESI